jgi:hypothetical protein
LLCKVASHNPVLVDDQYLEKAAVELQDTALAASQGSDALVAFNVDQLGPHTINASITSIQPLVDGLVVATAKRAGTQPVLHLVPTERRANEDLILTEYVLTDSQMAMGRVTYGSLETLKEVLAVAGKEISLFLVSQDCEWLDDAAAVVSEVVGAARVIPVRDKEVKRTYLFEVIDWTAQITGKRDSLFIYGGPEDASQLSPHFSKIFKKVVPMNGTGWKTGKQRFDVIVAISNPAEFDAEYLVESLAENGRLISFVPFVSPLIRQALGERFVFMDINQAYSGIVGQYLQLKKKVSASSNDFAKLAL